MRKQTIILVVLVLLTGCNPQAWINKFADAEKQKIAKDYIEQLKSGSLDELIAEVDPSLKSDDTPALFKGMRDLIPPGEPIVTEVVGYHSVFTSEQSTYNLSYQFEYDSKWLVINVAWREKSSEPRRIVGMRVLPMERSLQETNAFTFRGAHGAHYGFFALALAVPIFVLFTLVACIRTKIPRRKWLWIIFVLVGFGEFSINWTTGAVSVKALAVQLFGASAVAAMYGPWILSVSVPIGAIAFWFKRRTLAESSKTPPPAPPGCGAEVGG